MRNGWKVTLVIAVLLALLTAFPALGTSPNKLAKKVASALKLSKQAKKDASQAKADAAAALAAVKQGPKGDKGDTGAAGTNGSQPAFSFDQVATSQSTSSGTPGDLATPGPSVTVTVGSSGLVEVMAQADISRTGGTTGQSGVVTLLEDGFALPEDGGCTGGGNGILSTAAPSPITIRTSGTGCGVQPGSGSSAGGAGSSIMLPTSPGSHTYKLAYSKGGDATSATFADRKLWVAPR